MSSQFETDWFPHDVKPVYVGWYKTFLTQHKMQGWAFWDGELWSNQVLRRDQRIRANANWTQGAYQDKRWKGLNQPPEDPYEE